MLTRRKVHVDGDLIPFNKMLVHVMSHSFCRGSAIFEVISLHQTDKGACVFRLDDHVKRLFRSAELVHMPLPYSMKKFKDAVKETVRVNKIEKGMVKLMCYYGGVEFEVVPRNPAVTVAVVAVDPEKDLGAERFNKSLRKPAAVMTSRWRKVPPSSTPVECKCAASYMGGTIAKIEAIKEGYMTPLMLDDKGYVAEGPTESLFMVKNGRLITAPLGKILPGITRDTILTLAREYGIDTVERKFKPAELYKAEEAFFTSSVVKGWPICRIDKAEYNAPGEVTRLLDGIIDKILDRKVKRFNKWLVPVK